GISARAKACRNGPRRRTDVGCSVFLSTIEECSPDPGHDRGHVFRSLQTRHFRGLSRVDFRGVFVWAGEWWLLQLQGSHARTPSEKSAREKSHSNHLAPPASRI